MRNEWNEFLYAIDKYWLRLQKRDNWYLIIPLKVIQKTGYSDIRKVNVNYTALMTDLNKGLPTFDSNKFNMKNILHR
jgi:hypothetical protein